MKKGIKIAMYVIAGVIVLLVVNKFTGLFGNLSCMMDPKCSKGVQSNLETE